MKVGELEAAYEVVLKAAQLAHDGIATEGERRVLEMVRGAVETASPRLCSTCKHWQKWQKAKGEVLPECARIGPKIELEAETKRSSMAIYVGGEGRLRTASDFHCALWASKFETPSTEET